MEQTALVAIVLLAVTATSGYGQQMVRRTNIRAALANKMDPNFWPARGRRADIEPLQAQLLQHICPDSNVKRQTTSEEEGPFWANRGRSITDIDQFLNDIRNEVVHQGRSIGEDGPFWANRGRSSGEDGPFWANRGRSADKESGKDKDGPFWANRGRREEDDNERWSQDRLYVEEPGYFYLGSDSEKVHPPVRRNPLPENAMDDLDTFWVARGKKNHRPKREIEPMFSSPTKLSLYWMMRNRRDSKVSRALEKIKEANFWASRGKKLSGGNKHGTDSWSDRNE